MKYPAPLLMVLLACSQADALSRIELSQGGAIEARIIDERADRIVVDMGFAVFTIPRDSIGSITELEAATPTLESMGNLYSVIDDAPLLTVKELSEQVGDAVVTVNTPVGLGSGFIIHPSGYVITNDHVVASEHDIRVTVFERGEDGEYVRTQFENVRIVASSDDWDLALLKIEGVEGRRFRTVPLGDSTELKQGQRVFAVGNPLGLERSVSEGIVSTNNRLINGRLYVQDTAQISPGNSGGPLFNLRGEVVGVNNMKVTGFGAEGLGFAIPSETLRLFLENRDTFAFDPRNPNSGFRYNSPPSLSNNPTESSNENPPTKR